MKTQTYKIVSLEYPTGNRAYGAGGWSRRAKCRPQPERRELITKDVIFTSGKSVIVAGQRKLKLNIFIASTGEIVRADYPTAGLTEFGLTTRQIAARAAKSARLAKIEAAKIEAARQIELARRAEITASLPKDVAGWIAAGCVHPAPAEILAAKTASGLTWNQFERKVACE